MLKRFFRSSDFQFNSVASYEYLGGVADNLVAQDVALAGEAAEVL